MRRVRRQNPAQVLLSFIQNEATLLCDMQKTYGQLNDPMSSHQLSYKVTRRSGNEQRRVRIDLHEPTKSVCSCNYTREYGLPCVHIFAAFSKHGSASRAMDVVDRVYTPSALRQVYSMAFENGGEDTEDVDGSEEENDELEEQGEEQNASVENSANDNSNLPMVELFERVYPHIHQSVDDVTEVRPGTSGEKRVESGDEEGRSEEGDDGEEGARLNVEPCAAAANAFEREIVSLLKVWWEVWRRSKVLFLLKEGWGVLKEGWGVLKEGWGVLKEGWGLVLLKDGWGVLKEGWGLVLLKEGWGVLKEGWGLVLLKEGWGVLKEGWGLVLLKEKWGVLKEGWRLVLLKEGWGVLKERWGVLKEGWGLVLLKEKWGVLKEGWGLVLLKDGWGVFKEGWGLVLLKEGWGVLKEGWGLVLLKEGWGVLKEGWGLVKEGWGLVRLKEV
ncbi:unnamed protein product [Closterium sp. Yama58-4]|nr:unnamed protein product [Closterium sp. Yama58-4]